MRSCRAAAALLALLAGRSHGQETVDPAPSAPLGQVLKEAGVDEVVLETAQGEQVLRAGHCAGFPAGKGEAHRFVNRSGSDVLLLVIGDRTPGDEVYYPTLDLHARMQPDGKYLFTRKDGSSF